MAEVSNTCGGGGPHPINLDMKGAGLSGIFGGNIPSEEAFIGGNSIRTHGEVYCMIEAVEADNSDVPKLTRSRSRPMNIGDLVIPAQKLDDPSDGPEVRDADNFEGERGPRR